MKYLYSYIFMLSIFFAGILSVVCPYPIFSSAGTITTAQQTLINDANEVESKPYSKINKTSVVNLDWFETVNSIFPKFTDTRVLDIQTKTIYVVQRTGGYNHADVEPIDKENKDKFLSVYKGNWSWARRPVLVEINGMWVAGSINGMPHGYSLITDNDQDGHTCIHFLNSKTHGTKKVDAAHQNAVEKAYTAGIRGITIPELGLHT